MATPLTTPSHLRLSLAETLWLEPEYFEQARADSQCSQNKPQDEPHQWKAYLNSLGLSAFEAWAKEKLPTADVNAIASETAARYLDIEGFKVCLITTEHVLDEVIRFPASIIQQPDRAAHFYVVLEVLEEQQEAVIRGFLRYDELTRQLGSAAQLSNQSLLPLSAWDEEINHLLGYVQHSHPSSILSPQVSVQLEKAAASVPSGLTRLSRWLDEALTEGWQSIDLLINPQANLAWSARESASGMKGGKLMNLGMQIDQHRLALIVTVIPEAQKVSVNVQVLPTGEDVVLPQQLTVTLRSNTDKVLQTVAARSHDNYIQLRPFRGKPGIRFTVEVALDDAKVIEAFEL